MRGIGSCGERKRRSIGGTRSRTLGAVFTSSARGRATATPRGVRSWSSSSVARISGSAWKRARIAPSSEDVGDRDQGHPLVVRHVGADDRDGLALRETRRGVVERLVEAVAAAPAGGGQAREKFRTAARGSTIAASAVAYGATTTSSLRPRFRPEAGDAEVRVLVGELDVAHVVGGLRDAPGHAELARRSGSAGARRAGWSARAGCRPARASPATASGTRTSTRTRRSSAEPRSTGVSGAPEPEPVLHRDVALRDRDEAREARLGGQQVVAARVERPVGDPVADREQLPLGIEQEAELRAANPARPMPRASAAAARERGPRRPSARGRRPARRLARAPRRRRRRVRPARPCGGPGRGGPPRSGPAARRGSASRRARARAPARRPRGAPRASGRRGRARGCGCTRARSRPRRARRHPRRRPPARSGSARCRRRCPRAARAARDARRCPRDPREARPSEAATVSSASSSCLQVTVCVRRSSASERSGLAGERHRVRDPGEPFGADQRALDPLPARAGERDQVPGEVAAVDRGDVARARAAAGRGCRTSCRSGRGSARGASIVSRVASRRSTASSVPSQPKSRAATTESR